MIDKIALPAAATAILIGTATAIYCINKADKIALKSEQKARAKHRRHLDLVAEISHLESQWLKAMYRAEDPQLADELKAHIESLKAELQTLIK